MSPAAVLSLGIPVGRIGATPATPAAWADLLDRTPRAVKRTREQAERRSRVHVRREPRRVARAVVPDVRGTMSGQHRHHRRRASATSSRSRSRGRACTASRRSSRCTRASRAVRVVAAAARRDAPDAPQRRREDNPSRAKKKPTSTRPDGSSGHAIRSGRSARAFLAGGLLPAADQTVPLDWGQATPDAVGLAGLERVLEALLTDGAGCADGLGFAGVRFPRRGRTRSVSASRQAASSNQSVRVGAGAIRGMSGSSTSGRGRSFPPRGRFIPPEPAESRSRPPGPGRRPPGPRSALGNQLPPRTGRV